MAAMIPASPDVSDGPRSPKGLLVLALVATSLGASAQEGGQAAGQSLRPRLGVSQTWTDNLDLSSQSKDAALITTVSPGVSWASTSGALRGHLDYSLNGIAYLKTQRGSQIQNALNANGQLELVSGRLYTDFAATIAQQAVSAFGAQTVTPILDNSNSREVGNLLVSPYWRGQLTKWATYELRGSMARTETRGSSLGDGHTEGGSLRVSSAQGGPLGTWVMVNTQNSRFYGTGANRASSAIVGLNYRPDMDLQLGVNGGRERNNYQGQGLQDGNNVGLTADWTPTPRTRIGADWQRHIYGNSHSLSFEHRMVHSVWRFADTQALNLGNVGNANGVRTNYDQYFLLFASLEPDPVKRDQLVRAYLQQLGLSPDAPLATGFASAGPSRLRSQQFSGTLQGLRSSLTLLFTRSVSARVGSAAVGGDLASSSRVEQRSYVLSAGHQLTPQASLSLSAARQESDGDLSSQSTQLTSYSLSLSARLGQRLSSQLGGRHSRFEGPTPYAENAVFANLTQQF